MWPEKVPQALTLARQRVPAIAIFMWRRFHTAWPPGAAGAMALVTSWPQLQQPAQCAEGGARKKLVQRRANAALQDLVESNMRTERNTASV